MNLTLWKQKDGLCPVYTTAKGTKVVLARELWEALGLKKDFSNWIKQRITSHKLIDKTDYYCPETVLNGVFNLEGENLSQGGRPAKEYVLLLSVAKEIAMATMTAKGDEVRKYFLWCEQVKDAALTVVHTNAPRVSQTHLETARQLVAALETVMVMAPKAEFFDTVTQSDDELDLSQASKILNFGFGRNTLFQKLRDDGILRDNNEPYQKYVDCGYFRLVEYAYPKSDGTTGVGTKTVCTQKGLDFLNKRYGNNSQQLAA